MKVITKVAGILVLVGALNWGLVGLLGMNLVTSLLGDGSSIANIVYDLIGASALLVAYNMYLKKG